MPRVLQRQLARLADLAASRLRARELVAGCIGVKIRRDDFITFTRQRAVAPPTCEGRAIAGVAAELLARWLAANPGAKLRLLGVVLTELTPAAQLGLFEDTRRAQRAWTRRWMRPGRASAAGRCGAATRSSSIDSCTCRSSASTKSRSRSRRIRAICT